MYLFEDDDKDLGFVDVDQFSPRNTREALDLLVGESDLFDDYVSDYSKDSQKAPQKPQIVAKGYSSAREQGKMIYQLCVNACLSRDEIVDQFIKQMDVSKNTALMYFYRYKNNSWK